MLQIYTQAELGKWDKLLPYLLFTYRKVPHETWGFLPLKLLYGRYIRGLIPTILYNNWLDFCEEFCLDFVSKELVSIYT